MTNPFTEYPRIRRALYLVYGVAALILGALQVYGTESVGDLDVSRSLEVMAYLGIPLGFTAASNVPSYRDVVEGDAPPPDRGAMDIVQALLAVFILVAILVVLSWFVR